ncbi:lysophospholipase L1 and related esterases [Clostridium sp. CAG:590]|nr:lysophospholipase L1 and related esterases [Clostridium sp. CAG:590]
MKNILCFGDSNTYGLIPGVNGRYEWGVRWTSLLDRRVRKSGYRVVEEGLCGRTTVFEDAVRQGRKGLSWLPVLLEAHSPIDIVVLMLGTNDCKTLYHADAETIADGMESLVEVVRTFDPKIEIVVVSPIALGEGVGAEGYDPEFNENSVWVSRGLPETYRQVAKKWNSHFLAASDYAEPSVTDREHMDVEGHYHFAKGIGDLIEKIIRKQEQNRNLLSVS